MGKILAIDLGTNSMGVVVRDSEKDGKIINQFTDYGVVIFPKGVGGDENSYASFRTKKRSARRLYQVRKYRLWATLEVLIKNGCCPLTEDELNCWRKYDKVKGRTYPIDANDFERWIRLDFNGDGIPDYINPYELRKELVTIQLDMSIEQNRYKLGRALYHIAQRRGFRSSKGETLKDQAEAKDSQEYTLKKSEEKHASQITTYLQEHNIEPKIIGCALAHIAASGDRVRKEYQIVRSQYEDEIKYMFGYQEDLQNNDDFLKQVLKAIFFQRPLRSQKGLVGKCTLEPKKYRSPLSHFDFEEFRALSLLNNIKCFDEQLPLEMRNALYEEKFIKRQKADFKFEEIRVWIEKRISKPLSYREKSINYDDKTNVSGSPVSARMYKVFGENWRGFKVEKQGKVYTIEDVWHILTTTENSEWLEEFAIKTLNLDDKQTENLQRLNAAMPVGYSMLSKKAIKNINRYLKRGLIYTDAVLMAKLPDIFGNDWNNEIEEAIFNHIRIITEEIKARRVNYNIVNSLISSYKALGEDEIFAYRDTGYQLDAYDKSKIQQYTIDAYGERSWAKKSDHEQETIIQDISSLYQSFFGDNRRNYLKLPKIGEAIQEFVKKEYNISEEKAKKLYHPSQMDYYTPAKESEDLGIKLLGSPVIGAFKNPVATRALFQLRNLVNNFLRDGIIDEETRIVIELARDVNDANVRRAIELYQEERENENKEIIKILKEHYKNKDYQSNDAEIDSVRLCIEQWDIKQESNVRVEAKESTKKKAEFHKLEGLIAKIKLWKEQEFRCIYTGKVISLSGLLNSNDIDIEHTVPQSILPDNSLANKTICYANFNRNIKKNRIPSSLDNYEDIKLRLTPWINRIDKLKDNVNYYISKSKHAQDKGIKDDAIVQKHLWRMKLDYWQNKVDRFMIDEVNSGFRNSQLVDTRIISKYAMHYLRSLFTQVDVQNGKVTSDFRKMLGIQDESESKNRSLHSHHTIDAAVLSLIPKAAARDKMLKIYYQIQEERKLNRDVAYLERQLQGERNIHGIGSVAGVVDTIEKNVIANHTNKDVALTFAGIKAKHKGKEITKRGDSIRGQLHAETFYGAIKPAILDDNNHPVKDENGNYIQQEECVYVVRRELKFKSKSTDSGFDSLFDLRSEIVDTRLGAMIEKRVDELYCLDEQEKTNLKELKDTVLRNREKIAKNKKIPKEKRENLEEIEKETTKLEKEYAPFFKIAIEKGIYKSDKNGNWITKDKNGRKINPIRHIRCKTDVKNPLCIKTQTYKSTKEYKNYYYAEVGNLYAICRYISANNEIIYKPYNLFEITENRRLNNSPFLEQIIEKKEIYLLDKVIKRGANVLIHSGSPDELRDMENCELSKRLYVISSFEVDGNRVIMKRHLTAKAEKELGKGSSIKDISNLPEKIRCGINTVKCLFEKDDFIITPNGKIVFN